MSRMQRNQHLQSSRMVRGYLPTLQTGNLQSTLLAGIDRTIRDHGSKHYHTPSISLSTGEKISLAEWRESLLFIHSLIQRYTIHMQKNQYDYADQLEEYIADQCLLYFVDIDKSIHEHYDLVVMERTS